MTREDVVLVTGVGGPAGRVASSWFRERAIKVIGADMRDPGWPGADFVLLPPAVDPGFARALLAAVEATGAALLVPTVSDELPHVARVRPHVQALGCSLAMGAWQGVELANDKLRTARALAERGVPVPRTLSGDTPRQVVAERLGLPLLQKPRVGRGGRGVRVFASLDEVVAAPDGDVIWQEFAPGDEFDVNLFVERSGALAASAVLRKTALREGLTGNAAGVERVEHPGVRDVAERAVQALALVGPLDVDVRLGRSGEPLVLEINARLGANALSTPEVLEALHAAWRSRRCA